MLGRPWPSGRRLSFQGIFQSRLTPCAVWSSGLLTDLTPLHIAAGTKSQERNTLRWKSPEISLQLFKTQPVQVL